MKGKHGDPDDPEVHMILAWSVEMSEIPNCPESARKIFLLQQHSFSQGQEPQTVLIVLQVCSVDGVREQLKRTVKDETLF